MFLVAIHVRVFHVPVIRLQPSPIFRLCASLPPRTVRAGFVFSLTQGLSRWTRSFRFSQGLKRRFYLTSV